MNNPTGNVEYTSQNVIDAINAFNQSKSNQQRKEADLFLNQIRDSPNGFLICCQLFCNNLDPHVLFYCLHVFENVIQHR